MESLEGSEVDREIGLHEQPYGVLVVEVVRGSGLQLQKEEQHIAATNDTSLFIAAVVMVLGYLGLGVLWYVLMEEHCTTPVEGRPALCGGLGVDCSAGLTEATCDAITGCHYAAAIESVLHSCSSWTAVDALYFTVVTFTTIGYGDFTPTRPISKVFTALFALTGVALIGGALGIVAGYIIEKLNIEMKARLREAKEAEVLTGVNRHNTTDVDYQTTNQLGINRVRAEGRCARKNCLSFLSHFPHLCHMKALICQGRLGTNVRNVHSKHERPLFLRRAAIDNGLQLAVVIGIGVALFYGFGPDGMTGSDLVYAAVITGETNAPFPSLFSFLSSQLSCGNRIVRCFAKTGLGLMRTKQEKLNEMDGVGVCFTQHVRSGTATSASRRRPAAASARSTRCSP
jgi:hypothetical protein